MHIVSFRNKTINLASYVLKIQLYLFSAFVPYCTYLSTGNSAGLFDVNDFLP